MELQFIDKSVNVSAVNEYYRKMAEKKCDIHTLQIYVGGKRMLRIGQHPYSCDDAREIYSLSKTFAASVVGCAVDRGYFSVEDKVLDFFPEIETDNEHFKMMRVRHVLSMNTGHEGCVMPRMANADNSVKGFFSINPKYQPGTHFTYNTGATCLLGSIVERATGEKFFDFACKNLFWPLGITDVYWETCHDGACIAGAGLHASSDDIIKLFSMYANGGVYNGKRILSEKWISEATSIVSETPKTENPDWRSGYGYQIWHNARDGYRGDGAFGQLGMVLPKYDAVVAVQGIVADMNDEINGVIDLVEAITSSQPDGAAADFYHFAPFEKQENITPHDVTYEINAKAQGFKYLRVALDEDRIDLSFSDGRAIQTISAGNGYWLPSAYRAKEMYSTLVDLMPTEFEKYVPCEGCFTLEQDKLIMHVRYHVSPYTERYELKFDYDSVELNIENSIRVDKNRIFKGRRV